MLEKMTRNWWKFALRGMIAILFGVLALVWPVLTLQALVLVFGAFALMDGILAVTAGLSLAPYFNRWWAVLLEGVVGILVGLEAIFLPGVTGRALLYLFAAWGLITGVFEIVAAIQFRRVLTGEWMLILGGLLSILFGVLLFAFPGAGALSLAWLISLYTVFFGISEMVFAFRLHSLQREFKTAGAATF
jgi:uncharacterized membrane protein HdeD (DUF308 family)